MPARESTRDSLGQDVAGPHMDSGALMVCVSDIFSSHKMMYSTQSELNIPDDIPQGVQHRLSRRKSVRSEAAEEAIHVSSKGRYTRR
jgi:hypothetical protein